LKTRIFASETSQTVEITGEAPQIELTSAALTRIAGTWSQ